MKKLIISLAVAFALAITVINVCAFDDMPNDWSTAALQSAVDNGLLMGSNNKLLPKDNLTRAQMATIIVRALGATETADISHFSDVPKDKWYYSAMATSYKMGIFKGDNTGKLNPEAFITRQEAFVVLARAFNLSATTTSGLANFSDGSQVASWAKENIEALVSKGYVGGSNGKLNVNSNITRAEFAQVMYNLNKAYVDTPEELLSLGTIEGNIIIRGKAITTISNLTINGDVIIGDGVSSALKLDNVKINGRVVLRSSGNVTFNGNAKELVVSSSNTNVTVSKTSTINRITINAENSFVKTETQQTPDVVIPGGNNNNNNNNGGNEEDVTEEDIWTDFH